MRQRREDDGVTIVPQRVLTWFDVQLSKFGLRGPFARDCALAVVVAVVTMAVLVPIVRTDAVGLGDTVFGPLSQTQGGVIFGAATVQSLVLCLRRMLPVTCLAIVVGFQLVIIAAAPPEMNLRLIAPFVVAYTVGTMLTTRRAFIVAGAAVVVEGALAVLLTVDAATLGTLVVNHFSQALFAYAVGIFLGAYVRARRSYLALLRERADDAVRSRQSAVDSAISDERRGIARELHDVAAHHLSAMVVQTAAVQRLIDNDPEAAKQANVWIRTQGKETLADLRSVVGLLRSGSDDESHATLPGLTNLDDLVATAADLGSRVELVGTGPPAHLPPLTDVSLYRIAQEALTNARRHAPGAAVRVAVSHDDGVVQLQVVNGPARDREPDPVRRRPAVSRGERVASTGGRDELESDNVGTTLTEGSAAVSGDDGPAAPHHGAGLLGMRERARLVGAHLKVGPDGSGGWSVQVSVAGLQLEETGAAL